MARRSTTPAAGDVHGMKSSRPSVSSGHYYDEPDGYLGDFSESDALSGRPEDAVTEIYRRKPQTSAIPDPYGRHVYYPPEYLYDPVGYSQVVRHGTVPTLIRRVPLLAEPTSYYSAEPVEPNYRGAMVFNSQPQIASVCSQPSNRAVPANLVVRRHPVTVRTPRYYRKSYPLSAHKKPSTLCLPVASEPDPASYPRSKKQAELLDHIPSKHIEKTSSVQNSNPRKYNTAEDLQITNSSLDAVLTRYEKMFGEKCGQSLTSDILKTMEGKAKSKSSASSLIKPNVPPSIKSRQQKQNKDNKSGGSGKQKRTKAPEVTAEVLDSMLSELISSGCESGSQSNLKNERNEEPEGRDDNAKATSNDIRASCSTFNYEEVEKSSSKVGLPTRSQESICRRCSDALKDDTPKSMTPTRDPQELAAPNLSLGGVTSCCKTDHYSVDLHRSKSYIVNLIDRALSKELGTVPEGRVGGKEFDGVDAKSALELVNKYSNRMDKDVCTEITQTLTEAITNPSCPCTPHRDPRPEVICCCHGQGEEPLYIKQLKQLRWGHLRHIQREVKRLEDLERFLDSCTSSCS